MDKFSNKIKPTRDNLDKFKLHAGAMLHGYGIYALCFLIPAAVMFLIYLAHGVYPFGEESVLVLDLNGQYVYFFEELYDIVRGDGSLLYSFSRSLGGEYLGLFAYYLASPLSFLTVIFPRETITETLLFLFVLKVGLSGLTAGLYLRLSRGFKRTTALIFATSYALSAYAVVMQSNTMWIDGLIYLPLILLGVDRIIVHGKYKLFTVSLALTIISNFYIGYMTCIFVVIYFFCRYFGMKKEERNPSDARFHFLKTAGISAGAALTAVMISAVILLPAYYSLTFGKTTFTEPTYELEQTFDFLDMLSKMYIGSYDTIRYDGLPFIYSGMFTFMLLPLFFFAKKISTREKLSAGILIFIMIMSFNASLVDMFWHGMQFPIWMNHRYSFMLIFVFTIIGAEVFENISELGFRPIYVSAAAIGGLLLILQKLGYENLPDLTSVWVSLAFILLYLCLTRPMIHPSRFVQKYAAAIVAIFVCLEMFTAGVLSIKAMDEDVVYVERASYRDFIDEIRPVMDELRECDPSFYRSEKTMLRKFNDNAALGINGVTSSTSTLNKATLDFLYAIGISSDSNWSKYMGSTPMTDTLLGIKYILTKNPENFPLYVEEFTSGEITVMRNPYALSIGFAVSPDALDYEITDMPDTSFSIVNGMIASMTGGTDVPYRKAEGVTLTTENCLTAAHIGYTKYYPADASKQCTLTFTMTADSNDVLYCHFPGDYPRKVEMWVNGTHISSYFSTNYETILKIGTFEAGETVTVTMRLEDQNLFLANDPTTDFFYYLDETAFAKLVPQLSEGQFEITEYNDDYFKGTITVPEEKTLVQTTIPYDEGWRIKANGREIAPVETFGALLAFELEPGEYELTLEYRPDALTYGGIISALGTAIFAAGCVVPYSIKKKTHKGEKSV